MTSRFSVKVHSTSNLQETVNILHLSEQSGVRNISWSNDGQLLGVSTSQGSLTVFVTKLPLLSAISPPRIALLSSLAEVSLYQYSPDKQRPPPTIIPLEIEPTFLAIGSYHLACGMNNHVWFYDLGRSLADSPLLLGDREYMAEIKEVRINTLQCAVLCGGKIMLHPVSVFCSLHQWQSDNVSPFPSFFRSNPKIQQQRTSNHNCFRTTFTECKSP